MNRRQALLAAALLLLPCHAEEEKPAITFATYVTGLPACDRVEVVRIEEEETMEFEPEKLTEEQKSRLYHIRQARSWFKILDKSTVKGADAERLAVLFRGFQEHVFSKGTGVSFCHYPPYLYRFYAGDKLVGEASVCWLCDNLVLDPLGKGHLAYFKKEPRESQELLDASNKLFPDTPAK